MIDENIATTKKKTTRFKSDKNTKKRKQYNDK